jgi:MFS family permease
VTGTCFVSECDVDGDCDGDYSKTCNVATGLCEEIEDWENERVDTLSNIMQNLVLYSLLVACIFQVFFGYAYDIVGRKVLLLASLLLMAVFSSLTA